MRGRWIGAAALLAATCVPRLAPAGTQQYVCKQDPNGAPGQQTCGQEWVEQGGSSGGGGGSSAPATPRDVGRRLRGVCDGNLYLPICLRAAEKCAHAVSPNDIVFCHEARLDPPGIAERLFKRRCHAESESPACTAVRTTCRAGQRLTCEELQASVCAAGDRDSVTCPRAELCTPVHLDRACEDVTQEGTRDIQVGLLVSRVGDPARVGDLTTVVALSQNHRFAMGAGPLVPMVGIRADLGAGFGKHLGFAYDLDVLLGPALRSGPFVFALTGGGGLGGVTGGYVPFTWRVPVEAYAGVDLFPGLRARLFGRPSWVSADARKRGSKTLPFGDEFEAGLDVVIGKRRDESGWSNGGGLHIGFHTRELLGTRTYELLLGYSHVDASP